MNGKTVRWLEDNATKTFEDILDLPREKDRTHSTEIIQEQKKYPFDSQTIDWIKTTAAKSIEDILGPQQTKEITQIDTTDSDQDESTIQALPPSPQQDRHGKSTTLTALEDNLQWSPLMHTLETNVEEEHLTARYQTFPYETHKVTGTAEPHISRGEMTQGLKARGTLDPANKMIPFCTWVQLLCMAVVKRATGALATLVIDPYIMDASQKNHWVGQGTVFRNGWGTIPNPKASRCIMVTRSSFDNPRTEYKSLQETGHPFIMVAPRGFHETLGTHSKARVLTVERAANFSIETTLIVGIKARHIEILIMNGISCDSFTSTDWGMNFTSPTQIVDRLQFMHGAS